MKSADLMQNAVEKQSPCFPFSPVPPGSRTDQALGFLRMAFSVLIALVRIV